MQKWKEDFFRRQRLERFFNLVCVRKGGKKSTLSFKEVTIILNCLEFHFENPQVWDIFLKLTEDLILKNNKKTYGVAGVWERMRWEIKIVLKREDIAHKLNNNYKAFYARLFDFYSPLTGLSNGNFYTKRDSIMDHIDYELVNSHGTNTVYMTDQELNELDQRAKSKMLY
tara:strand:+ start:12406 stop:12915 length:510 start_codon:yes stop_codon:yes gene_type:complete